MHPLTEGIKKLCFCIPVCLRTRRRSSRRSRSDLRSGGGSVAPERRTTWEGRGLSGTRLRQPSSPSDSAARYRRQNLPPGNWYIYFEMHQFKINYTYTLWNEMACCCCVHCPLITAYLFDYVVVVESDVALLPETLAPLQLHVGFEEFALVVVFVLGGRHGKSRPVCSRPTIPAVNNER